MAYLRNDAVNRVNLHSGIQALANGAGGIFFLVFLLQAGISIPLALLAQAAILAGRFAIRPALLPLARRFGLKPLLVFGTVSLAVQYPLLGEVQGTGAALFALCIATAVGEVFYWLSYNAYFASIGDAGQRGRQIAVREALVAVAAVAAPLLGAWGLTVYGPRPTFALVGLVQAAAALPLLGAPNVAVKDSAPGVLRIARPAVILLVVDGWFDAGFVFVWQIALFVTLAGNIPAYGGAMALTGLVGAVCGLFIGRHIDAGHGRRAAALAYGVAAAIVVFRAGSLGAPAVAIAANAIGAALWPLLLPVLGGAIYDLAKASPCPFRFSLATEAGWDIGGFFACVVAAALLAAGIPIAAVVLLTLPAAWTGAVLLRRYYARSGRVETATVQ